MGGHSGWILAGLVLAGLCGCASTAHDQGRRLLERRDYAGAAQALQAALQQRPDDVEIAVQLAEAFYHQDQLVRAAFYLEQARGRDPGNGRAALILGLVREKEGKPEEAIEAYRTYASMGRLGKTRRLVEARLRALVRQQIRRDIQQALAQEEVLDVAAIPDNAVGVAPFRHIGSDPSLDPLGKGLADMMITDLSKVDRLVVVERVRMQALMQEIGLGKTGAVEAGTAPRLGRLLGARRVVNGAFTPLAQEQLRLDIEATDVRQGTSQSRETDGEWGRLFRLQKELTFGLIEEMGIELTDEERDAIEEIPTENLLAFIAYSRGLDLEDQGKVAEAARAYAEAVALDPQFEAAQQGRERLAGLATGQVELRALEGEVFIAETALEPAADDLRQRLAATGAYTGAGFVPADAAEPADVRDLVGEQEAVDFGAERAEVEIVVRLP